MISRKTIKRFFGRDFIIERDCNANFGKNESEGYAVGSDARGHRVFSIGNLNELHSKNMLIATNNFFKHKACDKTKFEQRRENLTNLNQLDYFLVRKCKKTHGKRFKLHQPANQHPII